MGEAVGGVGFAGQADLLVGVGQDAADIALVIDALDLMHSGRFDAFCLVSSDADFTPLALRLREQGMAVYGLGEERAPGSFRRACNEFRCLRPVADSSAKVAVANPAPAQAAGTKAKPARGATKDASTAPSASVVPLNPVVTAAAAPPKSPKSDPIAVPNQQRRPHAAIPLLKRAWRKATPDNKGRVTVSQMGTALRAVSQAPRTKTTGSPSSPICSERQVSSPWSPLPARSSSVSKMGSRSARRDGSRSIR